MSLGEYKALVVRRWMMVEDFREIKYPCVEEVRSGLYYERIISLRLISIPIPTLVV